MKPYPRYLNWLRFLCAYLILTYGSRKLIGSGQFALPPEVAQTPIGALSGFQLTWFYFGYSHVYSTLIALT